MKHIWLVIVLCLTLVGTSIAQDSEKAKRSSATLEKMRQIDLLNQLIPLVMTKEQIRGLLPVIEKCRAEVKKWQSEEADILAKYDVRVSKAVDDGVKNGDVPDKAFLKELNAVIRMFSMKREAIAAENTANVMTVMKAQLNAGQLKAAGNSLNPRVYDTNIKPEEMKDDDRLALFIREIMLDPLAYDLLVKMQSGKIG